MTSSTGPRRRRRPLAELRGRRPSPPPRTTTCLSAAFLLHVLTILPECSDQSGGGGVDGNDHPSRSFFVASALSREVLNHYPHPTSALPHRLSDTVATYSMAPNDDGDLVTGIYLVGGCGSDYVGHGGNGDTGGGDEGGNVVQYNCAKVVPDAVFYDPTKDYFEERKKMNRARYRHGAVSVEGRVWVFGGRDGKDNVVEEVEVYDPGCEHWVTIGSLPSSDPLMGLSDFAIFTYAEKIYLAGGYNTNYEAVSTTIMIDTAETLARNGEMCRLDGLGGGGQGVAWERKPSMRHARAMVRALVYGRYGYVAGGFTHLDGHCDPLTSVEIYDTKTDAWMAGGDMTVGRAGAGLMKVDGRFFALGGETRSFAASETGECPASSDGNDGGDAAAAANLLGANRRTPLRKTYPVNSVEVYNPIDGFDGEWHVIKGGLPDDERYRFVLAPWPTTESIYAFGGVTNYDPDTSTPCADCLHVSDAMIVYADEMEVYIEEGTNWVSELLVVISAIWFAGTVVSAFVTHWTAWRTRRTESKNSWYGTKDKGTIALVGMGKDGRGGGGGGGDDDDDDDDGGPEVL